MGIGGGFSSFEDGQTVLGEVLSGVESLIHGAFERIGGDQLLELGQGLELLGRKVQAAQIRLVDEVDQQGLATARSCTSTAALLRQALLISAGDAGARVRAARATRPQAVPSGGEAPPVLPLLGAAVDAGAVGAEHVRCAIATMRALPDALDAATRWEAEQTLVGYAVDLDPDQFRKAAAHLVEVINPGGKLNPDSAVKVEFHVGTRSAATGLTLITGHLDDLGAAILRKAIDGLAAPKPELDGVKDERPAAMRRAQALVEVMNFALNHRGVPSQQGGEVPHVTVTLNWDLLQHRVGTATLDDGTTLTPGATRQLLCDAKIIPAVLGGHSDVLDLGRSARTFNRAIRRAVALRDKGCVWPGCDRPPSWCESHHVTWWERDLGDTSYGNGVLLCRYHHSEIHRGEWEIVFAPDGVPELIPPTWIDKYQRPRRNTIHHLAPGTAA